MYDKLIVGQICFLGFLIALSVLRIALAKPLQRALWLKINSVRLALWAAVWALIVIAGSKTFRLDNPTIEWLAIGPILIILLSMFALTLIEIPAFWYAYIIKLIRLFKK